MISREVKQEIIRKVIETLSEEQLDTIYMYVLSSNGGKNEGRRKEGTD